MWVTLFALATAAAVWFSAANLAIELHKEQLAANSAIESRGQIPEAPNQPLWSAQAESRTSLTSRLD
jgi:hypothetical protein